jgi:hypothetical protein
LPSAIEIAKISDLSSITLNGAKWKFFTPVVGEPNHYFIATDHGNIYTFDNLAITEQAFFDLKKQLPNSNIKNFTALTIDAGFNYRDRDGYQSFYTAHVEPAKTDKKKLTISGKNLAFDAVIMQWHLDRTDKITPQVRAQREVFRVAIASPEQGIVQLSFDPFIEPWHANFGLLHIALASSPSDPTLPLTSGVILRINPNKFGLRQYTIPEDNPFVKNEAVNDEVIILGAQGLQSFNWYKNGQSQLVIKHLKDQSQVLSLANIGDNWLDSPNPKFLWQQKQNDVDFQYIFYRGRQLKNLWSNVLLLQNINQQWQLHSIPFKPASEPKEQTAQEQTTQELIFQGNLTHQAINPEADYTVFQSEENEIILIEQSNQTVFTIIPPTLASVVAKVPMTAEPENSHSGLWFFLVLLAISSAGTYYYKRSRGRHLLNTEWVNFDIHRSSQTIRLYKKRSSDAEKTLEINALVSSELILNDTVISQIDNTLEHGFSSSLEEKVRKIFGQEQRRKVIDNQQRKIQIKLTDNQKNSYLVCLYFRVGNIRMTKIKYSKVIENVIDWHWLFAQRINASVTKKRKMKVSVANIGDSTKSKSAHPPMTKSVTPSHSPKEFSATSQQDSHKNPGDKSVIANANVDTELVDALDKLAELRKQGYLDEQEFNTAKAKILKDLLN